MRITDLSRLGSRELSLYIETLQAYASPQRQLVSDDVLSVEAHFDTVTGSVYLSTDNEVAPSILRLEDGLLQECFMCGDIGQYLSLSAHATKLISDADSCSVGFCVRYLTLSYRYDELCDDHERLSQARASAIYRLLESGFLMPVMRMGLDYQAHRLSYEDFSDCFMQYVDKNYLDLTHADFDAVHAFFAPTTATA